MITQLRPFHTPEEFSRIYDHQYDHTRWPDHLERVAYTARVLAKFAQRCQVKSVADLSCGDATIIDLSAYPFEFVILGDFTRVPFGKWPGVGLIGKIENTIRDLQPVDMFVNTETLEHVEDPQWLLDEIRKKTRHLLLSTPHACWDDVNPEHYWAWDADDVRSMLRHAGFTEMTLSLFKPEAYSPYTFQVWCAS